METAFNILEALCDEISVSIANDDATKISAVRKSSAETSMSKNTRATANSRGSDYGRNALNNTTEDLMEGYMRFEDILDRSSNARCTVRRRELDAVKVLVELQLQDQMTANHRDDLFFATFSKKSYKQARPSQCLMV